MADVMLTRGVPEHVRSDNGAEMTAKVVRSWFAKLGAKTLYIEPGSLWKNGYCESFNGKLRDEYLNGEIFYSLKEAMRDAHAIRADHGRANDSDESRVHPRERRLLACRLRIVQTKP